MTRGALKLKLKVGVAWWDIARDGGQSADQCPDKRRRLSTSLVTWNPQHTRHPPPSGIIYTLGPHLYIQPYDQ